MAANHRHEADAPVHVCTRPSDPGQVRGASACARELAYPRARRRPAAAEAVDVALDGLGDGPAVPAGEPVGGVELGGVVRHPGELLLRDQHAQPEVGQLDAGVMSR